MSFEGKRIIVTGAASGMGHATATKLVEAGAQVFSLDRNTPSAAVRKHIAVDLSSSASIDRAVSELTGPWDALLNIAGVPGGKFEPEFVFSVNYLGLRHLTESLERQLNEGAAVVNVSSNGDVLWRTRREQHESLVQAKSFEEGLEWFRANSPEGKPYNFSKEAVSVYTIHRAIDFTQRRQRINALCPGLTETPLITHFTDSMGEERTQRVLDLVGGFASPEDIANIILFLASDESKFINGQVIDADAGLKAGMEAGVIPFPNY